MPYNTTAAILAASAATMPNVKRAAHFLVYTNRSFYTLYSAEQSLWVNPLDGSVVTIYIPV